MSTSGTVSCPICSLHEQLGGVQEDGSSSHLARALRSHASTLETNTTKLGNQLENLRKQQARLKAETERVDRELKDSEIQHSRLAFESECCAAALELSALSESHHHLRDLTLPDTGASTRLMALRWFLSNMSKLEEQTVEAAFKGFSHYISSTVLSEHDLGAPEWPSAITDLLSVAQESRPDKQQPMLAMLAELGRYDVLRHHLWTVGVFAFVVKLMTSVNEFVRLEACNVVMAMTVEDALKMAAIQQHKVLAPLEGMLKAPNEFFQEKACSTLWHLARADPCKVLIREAGLLATLVATLSSPAESVVGSCAVALGYLTRNDENKLVLAREGGLQALIALLDHPSSEVRARCAGALWNCAANAENKEKLREYDGLRAFVRVLEATDPLDVTCENVVENVAGAVWNCAVDTANKRALVDAGAIPALCRHLPPADDVLHLSSDEHAGGVADGSALENVTGTLWNLASSNEARVGIRKALAFPRLVALLAASSSAIVVDNVVGCLRSCMINDLNKDAIRTAGGLDALVQVMSTAQDGETVEKAASALCIGSLSRETQMHLQQSGALAVLSRFLQHKDTKVVEKVLGVFRNCATNADGKVQIGGSHKALVDLVLLVGPSHPPAVRQSAVTIIKSLARVDTNRINLRDIGALQALTHLLVEPLPAMLEHILGALAVLAANDTNREVLSDLGVDQLLVSFLSTAQSLVVQEHAVAILRHMAHLPQSCAVLRDENAIVPLAGVLHKSYDAMVRDACAIIRRLVRFLAADHDTDALAETEHAVATPLHTLQQRPTVSDGVRHAAQQALQAFADAAQTIDAGGGLR